MPMSSKASRPAKSMPKRPQAQCASEPSYAEAPQQRRQREEAQPLREPLEAPEEAPHEQEQTAKADEPQQRQHEELDQGLQGEAHCDRHDHWAPTNYLASKLVAQSSASDA